MTHKMCCLKKNVAFTWMMTILTLQIRDLQIQKLEGKKKSPRRLPITINYSFSTPLKPCVKPNSFHTAQSTMHVATLHLSLPSVSRYMRMFLNGSWHGPLHSKFCYEPSFCLVFFPHKNTKQAKNSLVTNFLELLLE